VERRLPALRSLTFDWWRIANGAAAGLLVLFVLGTAVASHHGDAWAYYSADLNDLYGGSRLGVVSYVYPPPLAQIVAPFRLLPFEMFYGLVLAGEVAALAWFVTPLGAVLLIASGQPNIADELINGNINLLLGAVVVAGFRWPHLWAAHGITKVTGLLPGLVWFGVRREWRALALAAGVTVAGLAASVAISPDAWRDWLAYVVRDYGNVPWYVTPLPGRLLLAAGIAAVAAHRDVRWPLPIAAVIAMPVPGLIHWTAALASLYLVRRSRRFPQGPSRR
jgi:hypothetical protein